MTPKFNMTKYQEIKNICYEEKLTQYKVLFNSSLHILLELLDQHLPTSTSHLLLLKHTWSPH